MRQQVSRREHSWRGNAYITITNIELRQPHIIHHPCAAQQARLGECGTAAPLTEAEAPGPGRRAGEGTGPTPVVAGDLTAVLRACLVALRVTTEANAWQPAQLALWRVADAVARIRQVLDAAPGGKGAELGAFLPRIGLAAPERDLRCKAAVASTLLAAMELARDGGVLLDQDRP